MKYLLTLLFIFSATPSFAQRRANVVILDPEIEGTELQNEFNVQRPSEFTSLPDKEERDLVFQGVKSVASFDELKKDILYMDLANKKPAELFAKYPEISKAEFSLMMKKR